MAETKRKKVREKTELQKKEPRRIKTAIYTTKTGHKLTIREKKFIDKYIETGNGLQSVVEAGFKSKTPAAYSNLLLNKNYIAEEIKSRVDSMQQGTIATAEEVMNYFSAVMRGEVKDQFGLEAPLSERTKAAQELAKRTVDIDNRLAGKEDAKVRIEIDWKRGKEDEE